MILIFSFNPVNYRFQLSTKCSLTFSFLSLADLNLGQIVLIGELLHHIRNTVLDIRKHTSEHDLQLIELSVGLLNVVVSDLANLSKSDDSVLQLITTFRILVFQESLLLGNKHFVDALIKWWSERALT